jgi:hypothetical protein
MSRNFFLLSIVHEDNWIGKIKGILNNLNKKKLIVQNFVWILLGKLKYQTHSQHFASAVIHGQELFSSPFQTPLRAVLIVINYINQFINQDRKQTGT